MIKRILIIMLSILCVSFYGCGGDTGGLYSVSVNFKDSKNENTLTVDIAQDACGTYEVAGLFPPQDEFYTDAFANITIKVLAGMPGLTIRGYTIAYMPLISANGLGNMISPPTINDLTDQGSINIHIPTNSTSTFTIPCLTMDQKEDVVRILGWTWDERVAEIVPGDPDPDGDPLTDDAEPDEIKYSRFWIPAAGGTYIDLDICRYTIHIILHCEDASGASRDITVSKSLNLGDYDNC